MRTPIQIVVDRVISKRDFVAGCSPAERIETRVLFSLMILALVSLPFFILMMLLLSLPFIAVSNALCLTVVLALYFSYNSYSDHQNISNIFCITAFFLFLSPYVLSGAEFSSAMVWTIIYPLVTLNHHGIKKGIIATIAVTITILGVNLLQAQLGAPIFFVNELVQKNYLYFNLAFAPVILFSITLIFYLSKEELIKRVMEREVELEYSKESRDYLLSILFHDLANSIFVTKHYSSPKRNIGKDNERLLRNIEKIHKSTKNIEGIIKHVREMKLNNIDPSMTDLSPVCLDSIFTQVSFLFEHKLQEKNITLHISKNSVPSLQVLAEETSLCNSVFNNIISNSIKFSAPNSSIHINVKKESESAVIEIEDSGIGIPESMRINIFDFNQLTTREGTSGEKGTGHGLPIVKKYIDFFNGSIHFKSNKPGTTFIIKLPLI